MSPITDVPATRARSLLTAREFAYIRATVTDIGWRATTHTA
ncbi:hypothetical protein [Streptomyces sp. SID3212]|nr:hypothetical protein [Streptomyces sp. SID3212]